MQLYQYSEYYKCDYDKIVRVESLTDSGITKAGRTARYSFEGYLKFFPKMLTRDVLMAEVINANYDENHILVLSVILPSEVHYSWYVRYDPPTVKDIFETTNINRVRTTSNKPYNIVYPENEEEKVIPLKTLSDAEDLDKTCEVNSFELGTDDVYRIYVRKIELPTYNLSDFLYTLNNNRDWFDGHMRNMNNDDENESPVKKYFNDIMAVKIIGQTKTKYYPSSSLEGYIDLYDKDNKLLFELNNINIIDYCLKTLRPETLSSVVLGVQYTHNTMCITISNDDYAPYSRDPMDDKIFLSYFKDIYMTKRSSQYMKQLGKDLLETDIKLKDKLKKKENKNEL